MPGNPSGIFKLFTDDWKLGPAADIFRNPTCDDVYDYRLDREHRRGIQNYRLSGSQSLILGPSRSMTNARHFKKVQCDVVAGTS